MKIYIAHNFAARESLLPSIVSTLEKWGHEITSQWLVCQKGAMPETATMDIEDVDRADAILFFTEQYGPTPGRGKYFELGYAYASGKTVFILGKADNCIFFRLPKVIRLTSLNELENR